MIPAEYARLFAYNHLPEHLQAVSKPFADLAHLTCLGMGDGFSSANPPDNRLIGDVLMKLWEAKNLAVLAAVGP